MSVPKVPSAHISTASSSSSLVLDELDVAVHSEEDSTSKWPGWMVGPWIMVTGSAGTAAIHENTVVFVASQHGWHDLQDCHMVEPLPCLEGELRGAHWYLSCCSMVSGSTAHEGYHS